MYYLYLAIAIISEIFATSFLKASNGFTVPLPSFLVILGYIVSFYTLSLCTLHLPTGLIYAVWSGVGIVGIAVAAYFIYGQRLDLPSIIGIALILAGVLVIKLFSKSVI